MLHERTKIPSVTIGTMSFLPFFLQNAATTIMERGFRVS
jgi:hypothetical protein